MARPTEGFSLLEVMIAAVVLSFGLLGLVAMQSTARFAGYEARQRTVASWLANDMAERARANRAIWVNQAANVWTVAESSALTRPSCSNADGTYAACSDSDLLSTDLVNWQQAVTGVAVSGAGATLQGPLGCVIRGANNRLTVAIFWSGRQRQYDAAGAVDTAVLTPCGITGADLTRRQYVLVTTL